MEGRRIWQFVVDRSQSPAFAFSGKGAMILVEEKEPG